MTIQRDGEALTLNRAVLRLRDGAPEGDTPLTNHRRTAGAVDLKDLVFVLGYWQARVAG